MGSISSHAYS